MMTRTILLFAAALTLGCDRSPKAEVVSTNLATFKNPDNGTVFQEVLVSWKNAGNVPIRVVSEHHKGVTEFRDVESIEF